MVKITQASNAELSRIFYLVLLSLAGALIGLLAIGTIYALARSPDSRPLFRLGRSTGTEEAGASAFSPNDDIRVFSGMGRLRIPLSNSSIMILSIAFPYSAADVAFTEELAGKIGEFRGIASGYFSSLPAEKLINVDEEAAKNEILRRFNAGLRLGRIEALYFSDMLIIDGNL